MKHYLQLAGHKFEVCLFHNNSLAISAKDVSKTFNTKIEPETRVWIDQFIFARILIWYCLHPKNQESEFRKITVAKFQDALDKAKEELLEKGV